MICCSPRFTASWIRCHSSLRNRNTYTPWATIRPRYNGTCNQRDQKIRVGSGASRVAMRASFWLMVNGSLARQHGADGADQAGAEQPVSEAAIGAQGKGLRLFMGDRKFGVAELGKFGSAAHFTREREQGFAR